MVKLFPFALVAAVAYVVIENRRRGTEHAWSLKSVSARPAPRRERLGDAPWYALLAPVIPLVLALGLDVAIIPSMLAGVLYALVTTTRPGEMNKRLLRTLYGGFEVAAPPLALFVAIGILLAAVKLPGAVDALEPLMKAVSPQNPVLFVIVFTVLVPLCLYRGPLNVFGLGAGIAGVLIATGIYPAVAVLGMATSYNQVFGVATRPARRPCGPRSTRASVRSRSWSAPCPTCGWSPSAACASPPPCTCDTSVRVTSPLTQESTCTSRTSTAVCS